MKQSTKTDIVERLRAADISGHGEYSALVREAAAEIGRLRAALTKIQKIAADAIEAAKRPSVGPW